MLPITTEKCEGYPSNNIAEIRKSMIFERLHTSTLK